MSILTTFIQHYIGSHSHTNDRSRNNESIQNGKEEVKLLHANDIYYNYRKPQDFTQNS